MQNQMFAIFVGFDLLRNTRTYPGRTTRNHFAQKLDSVLKKMGHYLLMEAIMTLGV